VNERFEHTPAMLVIFKLVEARARGREQDDVSGPRRLGCDLDSALKGAGTLDSHASVNLVRDFVSRCTYQQRQNRPFM
jgi:hypothetical protein